jgi:hypothetical protein
LELEGVCMDTGHKIYTGSGCQGDEPYVLFREHVYYGALHLVVGFVELSS